MSTPETPTPAAGTDATNGTNGTNGTADPTAVDPTVVPADLQDERLIASQGFGGWASATWGRLRSGDLGSLPVVVGLVLIWGVFYALEPAFLSSRNLVNLSLQMVAVGTIAIGIVLVLLLGEIDLSIGSMAGLSAAILAVMFVAKETSVILAVLAALGAGAVVGLAYGTLFNRFGVPSFVITLAGLLALLGLQLRVLGNQGTINLPFESSLVRFASQQFLPVWVAYVLALIAPAVYALSALRRNARRAEAGLSTVPVTRLALRAAGLAAILIVVVAVLNRDRGVSVMFLTFLAPRRRHGPRDPANPVGPFGPRHRRQRRGRASCRHQRPADLPVGLHAVLDVRGPRRHLRRVAPRRRPTRAAAAATPTSTPSPPPSSAARACSAVAGPRTPRCSASSSSSRSPTAWTCSPSSPTSSTW